MKRREVIGGMGLMSLGAILARAQIPADYGIAATTSGDLVDLAAEAKIGPNGAKDLAIANSSDSGSDLIGEAWECQDTPTAVSSSAAGFRIPPGGSKSISLRDGVSPDERICSFTVAVPTSGDAVFDWMAN